MSSPFIKRRIVPAASFSGIIFFSSLFSSFQNPTSLPDITDTGWDGITDVFSVGSADEWRVSFGSASAWQTINNYPPGIGVDKMAFADFDGDGKTDIFYIDPQYRWNISYGGITSWQQVNSYSNLDIDRIRTGDFDGNGKADIFYVTGGGSWRVSYEAKTAWTILNSAGGITIEKYGFADFDGDAKTDVFYVDNLYRWMISSGGTTAWKQVGSNTGVTIDKYRFGDFNGDGKAEIFYVDPDGQWRVYYEGTGFLTINSYPGVKIGSYRIGDWDGDLRADVFYVNSSYQWCVSYGGMTAWAVINSAPGVAIEKMAFGDFGGSAKSPESFGYGNTKINSIPVAGERPLLVVLNEFSDVKLHHSTAYYQPIFDTLTSPNVSGYYQENSSGRFRWGPVTVLGPVVQADYPDTLGDESSFYCFYERDPNSQCFPLTEIDKPDNTFYRYHQAALNAAGRLGFNFDALDKNGDGKVLADELSMLVIGIGNGGDKKADAFTVDPSTYQWQMLTGIDDPRRGMETANQFSGVPITQYRFADFDGDRMTDVFYIDAAYQWKISSGAVTPWKTVNSFASVPISQYGFGDFNGDGKADVFYVTSAGQWQVSYGATSRWQTLNSFAGVTIDKYRFADFDGDAKTDVFYINSSGQWQVSYGGTSRWQTLNSYAGVKIDQYRFADFDGDGKADVFYVTSSGQWQISYGGAGRWQAANSYSGVPIAKYRLADFDGDGKTDILYINDSHQWFISYGATQPWTAVNNQAPKVDIDQFAFFDFGEGSDGGGTASGNGCSVPYGAHVTVCIGTAGIREDSSFLVFAHELGHLVGAPDLNAIPPGKHCYSQGASLMSCCGTIGKMNELFTGSYHLDAWDKVQLGWQEPRVLSMQAAGSCAVLTAQQYRSPKPQPILFYNTSTGANQYFLLEYRLRNPPIDSEYDLWTGDDGVVIWYVGVTSVYPITVALTEPTALAADGVPSYWTNANGDIWLRLQMNGWLDPAGNNLHLHIGTVPAIGGRVEIEWGSGKLKTPSIGQLIGSASGRPGSEIKLYGFFGVPGSGRIPSLRGASRSYDLEVVNWSCRFVTLRVPSSVPAGTYSLVIYADSARSTKSNEISYTIS